MKIEEGYSQGYKTLWEKEELLILLFPQCFQKTCTADTQKPRLVWEKFKQLLSSSIFQSTSKTKHFENRSFSFMMLS